MWKCPVCGAEAPAVTICPQCGFDGSRDYEHYPTVSAAASARSIQALRAEWARQNQPQPQNGADLYHTVTITPELAASGCQVTVTRPDGRNLTVAVPANCQNGGLLRCAGQGYPGQNGGRNGDLLISIQIQAPVSSAQTQPVQQQNMTAPVQQPSAQQPQPAQPRSRKKSGLIVGICSAVVILVLLVKVFTGSDTPAADTGADIGDITVPDIVLQNPGIANCKAHYVDWYADDNSYALALTMSEDSDAETVTVDQLQAMIDEKGCTTLTVEHFDNASAAMWLQIEKLTGIKTLCIYYCTVSDLELLSGMRDLKELGFYISQVDLTGIGALTNLTGLSLDVCNIDDISPLSELRNLQNLYSRRNYISDLSPLAGLTQLTELSIQNYDDHSEEEYDWQLKDITPLANLTNLTLLNLSQNRISDLTPLSNMTKLTALHLDFNKITDITPLANLTELTSLDISYNKIADITPLSNLTELTSLTIYGNEISDWSPLANLTKLETLEPDVQIGG